MTFQSNATTKKGVLNDFVSSMVRDMVGKGRVPSSVGQNRPIPQFENSKDAITFVSSLWDEQRDNLGGHALDSFTTPVGDTYRDRRFKFLSDLEGIREKAYDDKTGKPITDPAKKQGLATVGLGFNMDRPGARDTFAKVLPGVNFDAIYSGKASLNSNQVRVLFDHTIDEAEKHVATKFRGVPISEQQRLTLVSLAFNNPSLIGPKLTEAVKKGDTQSALNEILHNSNKGRVRGLGSRRWREAFLFAGPEGGKKLVPSYADYMKQFA